MLESAGAVAMSRFGGASVFSWTGGIFGEFPIDEIGDEEVPSACAGTFCDIRSEAALCVELGSCNPTVDGSTSCVWVDGVAVGSVAIGIVRCRYWSSMNIRSADEYWSRGGVRDLIVDISCHIWMVMA